MCVFSFCNKVMLASMVGLEGPLRRWKKKNLSPWPSNIPIKHKGAVWRKANSRNEINKGTETDRNRSQ